MEVREGLLYSKSHEWVKEEGDVVVIGLTDFAQSELSLIHIYASAAGYLSDGRGACGGKRVPWRESYNDTASICCKICCSQSGDSGEGCRGS